MTSSNESDAKSGGPQAAREAARRLRSIGEGAPIDEEPPELIRLASLAATHIVGASHNAYSPEQRAQMSDNLLAALTVMRFSRHLGGDPDATEAARAKVLKFAELFEMAIDLASE
ncbi:MAG TPA: hypothetical protein VFX67_01775 [Burkholderiales bacterium]|nr:hypothetical protein [Burkholderiales bacterium]